MHLESTSGKRRDCPVEAMARKWTTILTVPGSLGTMRVKGTIGSSSSASISKTCRSRELVREAESARAAGGQGRIPPPRWLGSIWLPRADSTLARMG